MSEHEFYEPELTEIEARLSAMSPMVARLNRARNDLSRGARIRVSGARSNQVGLAGCHRGLVAAFGWIDRGVVASAPGANRLCGTRNRHNRTAGETTAAACCARDSGSRLRGRKATSILAARSGTREAVGGRTTFEIGNWHCNWGSNRCLSRWMRPAVAPRLPFVMPIGVTGR